MSSEAEERAPGGAASERPFGTVATFSGGVAGIPHLAALLGAERVCLRPKPGRARSLDAVVGWGEKPNTKVAQAYARRHGLPYWRVEDGFLRSVGLGVSGEPPLSVVLDDEGIYYDARKPSRLERLLSATGPDDPLADPGLLSRARRAMTRIREARLSKYNDAPTGRADLGAPRGRGRVLVVDQTRGDMSVGCGLADETSFRAMFDAATSENPDAEIVVKIHPDVLAGKKRGYLEDVRDAGRVRLLTQPVSPIALLEEVDRVYVVTSQLGFEALVCHKPVTCFGAPFYAGWGLTDDRIAMERRRVKRSTEAVFAAAFILYPRYVDPDTDEPCGIERVIDHLALQRKLFADNAGTIIGLGFPFWKRRYVRAYLRSPDATVEFPRSARRARDLARADDAAILVWGRPNATARRLAGAHGLRVWHMEDGFLRSVGLGSDLEMPASLVIDTEGIYYDPTHPSALERALQEGAATADDLARARSLRAAIVQAKLSKYNVGRPLEAEIPQGARVVLVPGQVSDDLSIRLGCRDIRTNLALLREVRRRLPGAYVIFKPHPDVVSGNREGDLSREEARALCDHVEREASIASCLEVAHEVHTLTSLVGFEALLRGLAVATYGQPFYAGWGLTDDRHPLPRRTRTLSIDELVAGALIRYPRYLNRTTGRFTTPEVIIDQLAAGRRRDRRAEKISGFRPLRQLRRLVSATKGMIHAP